MRKRISSEMQMVSTRLEKVKYMGEYDNMAHNGVYDNFLFQADEYLKYVIFETVTILVLAVLQVKFIARTIDSKTIL